MATLADINNTLIANNAIAERSDSKIDALAQMWADYTFDYRRRANAAERQAREAGREASASQQKSGNMAAGTASGIAGSASNLLSGFTLGSMGLGAAGLLGTIGGFLKTGLFAAIGIALADELGEYVEGLTGSQILGNMTEWAAIGGAAGFLFGPKFGIYGAIAGALFSDTARQKIVDGINGVLSTELEKNDWTAWGVAAGGLLGLQIGPRLLTGALGGLMGIGSNIEVDKNGNLKDKKSKKYISKSFGNKFKSGFRRNAALGVGVVAIGSALSSVIGNTLGEEAGGIAQDAVNVAGLATMFAGTGAAIPLAIAGLAIVAGGAIIGYLRDKQDKLIEEAKTNIDKATDRGFENADGTVLRDEADRQLVASGVNELERRAEIGQLDVEAAAALQKAKAAVAATDKAAGKITSEGTKTLAADAVLSGSDRFFDLVLEKMTQSNLDAQTAAIQIAGDASRKDLGLGTTTAQAGQFARMNQTQMANEIAEAIERRDARAQTPPPVVAPQIDASTKVTTAPQAINMGGAGANSTHNSYIASMANAGIT